MKILLDTHCFLWWIHEPERLSPEVLERIADERHFVMLSAASAWEIAIKYALGKLKLPQPPADFIPERCASNRILTLAIQHEHALRVAALPMHHTD
ncbi:MAG TPA: type II toxin-antitoxin system VapC family toxin, partial [Myxococcaceae bacterium]|nr:type II toxin-antitoxin system VapC family toxin [Myxococcaceae bacterium]